MWPLLLHTLISRDTSCDDVVPSRKRSRSSFHSAQGGSDRDTRVLHALFYSALLCLYFAIVGTGFRDSHKHSTTGPSSQSFKMSWALSKFPNLASNSYCSSGWLWSWDLLASASE